MNKLFIALGVIVAIGVAVVAWRESHQHATPPQGQSLTVAPGGNLVLPK